MPNCSCGATLPEDARFCHRCGKPQRDEPLVPESIPTPVIRADINGGVISSPTTVPRVTFGDPLALRSCLLVASVTTLLTILPFAILVAPLLGGFASVALYQHRSGKPLSPGDGAKLGWMTAVISSLLLTIFTTLSIAVSGSSFEAFRQQIRQQMTASGGQQFVNEPWFLVTLVLMAWVLLFGFVSVMSILGGALGAHFRKQKA